MSIIDCASSGGTEAAKADREMSHRDLRIGDLVFIRVNARPFLEVARATCSWTNHVGIVVGVGENDSLIAESTFPLSRVTTMSRFLARSSGGFAIARLKQPLDRAQQRSLISAATRRSGVFYDTGFNIESQRQFCSRFVREVIFEATGVSIGEVETFETLLRRNPRHPLGFWRCWYLGWIPWQRRTVTPASLLASPHVRVFWDNHCNDIEGARPSIARKSHDDGDDVALRMSIGAKWLEWLVGPLANKNVIRRMITRNAGLPWRADNSRSRNELGIRYRPLAESMNDFFQQLVETGQLRR
ncbi:YebB family permuted papain-like enzyme [Trinickia dinghuensis]|uniref:YebB family permuted papain-like enzyme n=1 Tax=Trinickia dinghuensis TaxID=2291023 RepID=UPI001FE7D313|nr:YebB family permuted papain-like enzyme [Trinickia dinghuensis]